MFRKAINKRIVLRKKINRLSNSIVFIKNKLIKKEAINEIKNFV